MDDDSSAGGDAADTAIDDDFPVYRAEDYEDPRRTAAAAAAETAGVGASRSVARSAGPAGVPRGRPNARRVGALLATNWGAFCEEVSAYPADGGRRRGVAGVVSLPG